MYSVHELERIVNNRYIKQAKSKKKLLGKLLHVICILETILQIWLMSKEHYYALGCC